MYTRRRRSALFAFLFLLFAACAVYDRIGQVLRSPWRRLVIRSVGLEKRMEKRLKSGLESLNLTTQGYEVTSSVYETTTSVHLITSMRNQPTPFWLYR